MDVPEGCPVFDSCDEMRRKLSAFLAFGCGVNQTQLLAVLGAQSNQLASFRKQKGAGGGAANRVYRAGFRFFEQQRILEGRPKTAGRLKAEAAQGPGGYPLVHDGGKRWCFG